MSTNPSEIIAQLDSERRTVSYDAFDIIVRQLIDMVRSSEINIAPDYQRQFIWKSGRESELIESILLGIPVPSLYMAVNSADGSWEVVDGVQRLSTILHFAGGDEFLQMIGRDAPLRLEGLRKLTSFNGLQFAELPPSVRTTFTNRGLRVSVLNDRSDFNVRFDLFERLNTGGVALHPQEIRSILFRGDFKELLRELSNDADFRQVVILPKEKTSADFEEAALRFFAFVEGYGTFDHSVRDFLNQYIQSHPDGPGDKLVALFRNTFALLKVEIPEGIKRGAGTVTPINLYEAIAVGTALVINAGRAPKAGVLLELLQDDKLRSYTTAGTNSRKMVTSRIEYVRDALA